MGKRVILKKVSSDLNTRALADSIFSAKDLGDDFLIDFDGVETATPSFCHEMLVVLRKKKAKFKLINVNNGVRLQMQKAIGSIQNV